MVTKAEYYAAYEAKKAHYRLIEAIKQKFKAQQEKEIHDAEEYIAGCNATMAQHERENREEMRAAIDRVLDEYGKLPGCGGLWIDLKKAVWNDRK